MRATGRCGSVPPVRHQRPDAIGRRGRRRIVNHHPQLRPPVDHECGEFQLKQAGLLVVDALQSLAVCDDVVIAPEGGEFRAGAGEPFAGDGLLRKVESKRFFFEKKKQKTFIPFGLRQSNARRPNG
jgi:hypothetical protein